MRCDDAIPVFAGGEEIRRVCRVEAERQGLTIVDLSDDWVPRALRAPAHLGQPQPYRDRYVALANEDFGRGPAWERARKERYFEPYGVFPSLRVVARRLLDEGRHACNDALDPRPIEALEASPQPFSAARTESVKAALLALEDRLICERLLPVEAKRRPRWRLQAALDAFQRKHMIVSHGRLDDETKRALAETSRELSFRAVLRTLRARVVDATGLIEDGTARANRRTILGRRIDGDAFYRYRRGEGMPNGAPDLISSATEAAARALGWTDPEAAADFFRARAAGGTSELVVALRLPPVPSYHAEHMELRAEIDRGDVWYELPRRRGPIKRRPTLTLYARDSSGEEIALVRWPTTIGGWKKEARRWGTVGLRYKPSDVGKAVWRHIIASPTWVPPKGTPPRSLIKRAWGRGPNWVAKTKLVGPGYASAFGMVMLVHEREVERRGETTLYDNGIRTHGSVGYRSILRGESHGCHRLFNHAALQLSSFLLRHRRHVVYGVVDKPFTRIIRWRGRRFELPIPHRGYRFELTPPVEVNVLRGRIRGRVRRVPRRFVWMPRKTLARSP